MSTLNHLIELRIFRIRLLFPSRLGFRAWPYLRLQLHLNLSYSGSAGPEGTRKSEFARISEYSAQTCLKFEIYYIFLFFLSVNEMTVDWNRELPTMAVIERFGCIFLLNKTGFI